MPDVHHPREEKVDESATPNLSVEHPDVSLERVQEPSSSQGSKVAREKEKEDEVIEENPSAFVRTVEDSTVIYKKAPSGGDGKSGKSGRWREKYSSREIDPPRPYQPQ